MVRTSIVSVLVAAAVLCASVSARAAVSCEQVRKYAGSGRSAEDISDTMVVPLDEVKKCLEGEKAGDKKAGSSKESGAGKEAAPSGGHGSMGH